MADLGFDFSEDVEEEYDDIEALEEPGTSLPGSDIPVPADPPPAAGVPTNDAGGLASLRNNDVLVDSIDDASPKLLEAVLPNQFAEDDLAPLERLCIRSQSTLTFLRVWAAREIKNILHTAAVEDILQTIFPVAFQLSVDRDRVVRETLAYDLPPLLLYFYRHGHPPSAGPDGGVSPLPIRKPLNPLLAHTVGEEAITTTLADRDSAPADPSAANPITHALFHEWLDTMLLDPSPVVVSLVQAALVQLGYHMRFELYHTEVIHHTILGLVKPTLKSRPASIDGLVEARMASHPRNGGSGIGGMSAPTEGLGSVDSSGSCLRRKLAALHLIKAVVQEFGAALKPAVFVPTIERTAADSAFEVRRDTALTLGGLAHALSYDLVLEGLCPIFQQLVQDPNWQVRQAAARAALPELAQVLVANPTKSVRSPHLGPAVLRSSSSAALLGSPGNLASRQSASGPTTGSNSATVPTRAASIGSLSFLSAGGSGNGHSASNGGASLAVVASPHLPAPPPPLPIKVWTQILERLLGSREVSYPVQTAVFEVMGRLMVAFEKVDKVKEVLVRYYLHAVARVEDPDAMPTPEIVYQCAFNFPAMLLTMGTARWDELADAYFDLTHVDQTEARVTLAHSLHEVARLLGPNYGESVHEKIFVYFLVDVDEVQLAVLGNVARFLECLYPAGRDRCLPHILEAFRGEGSNWRPREIMAQQIAPMCHLFPVRVVVRHLLPLAVHWAKDPVAAVREAAASAFPVVFAMTKEDPALQVQFFESMIQFRNAATFRLRLFFVQICEALLNQAVDPTDFEQFFLPSLLALAQDKVANVRIAVARTLERLLASSKAGEVSRHSGGSRPSPSSSSSSQQSHSPPRSYYSPNVSPSPAPAVPPQSLLMTDAPSAAKDSSGDSASPGHGIGPAEESMNAAAAASRAGDSGTETSTSRPTSPRVPHGWTATRSQLISDLIAVLREDRDRDVLAIVGNLPTLPAVSATPSEDGDTSPQCEAAAVEGSGQLASEGVLQLAQDLTTASITSPDDDHRALPRAGPQVSIPSQGLRLNMEPVRKHRVAVNGRSPVAASDRSPVNLTLPVNMTDDPSSPVEPVVTRHPQLPTIQTPAYNEADVPAAEPSPSREAIEISRPSFSFPSFSFSRKKSAPDDAGLTVATPEQPPADVANGERTEASHTASVTAPINATGTGTPIAANATPAEKPRASMSLLSRITALPSLLENPLADVRFTVPLGKARSQPHSAGSRTPPVTKGFNPLPAALLGDDPRAHVVLSDTKPTTVATELPPASPLVGPVPRGKYTFAWGTDANIPSVGLLRTTRTPSPPAAAAAVFQADRRVRRTQSHPLDLADLIPNHHHQSSASTLSSGPSASMSPQGLTGTFPTSPLPSPSRISEAALASPGLPRYMGLIIPSPAKSTGGHDGEVKSGDHHLEFLRTASPVTPNQPPMVPTVKSASKGGR
ncbi:hypothetical protein IWQ60_008800 [Tieghemiomyces parasiticus]|uniref:Uncharacterized protein n=1 Tax=Tieghemiomyces parasiticus TaxID=78921 RepID=A0A9W8DKZ7_9FUNG|nr:hypothetical protein IWQ60_008800 [Tieghemiomyces parasiticus]